MNELFEAVQKAGKAQLNILKTEAYDKLSISPKTTMRYLKELEELGKIEIDEKNNIVRLPKLS